MRTASLITCALLSLIWVTADVIECENGDRYHGKVLSMDDKTVKLQNEIVGALTIPRAKITSISFRPAGAPLSQKPAPAQGANLDLSQLAPGQRIKVDPAAVEQVQNQLLATASPEAQQLYQQMVGGLMSGQLNLGDIRVKAQSALKDLREMQKELGDEDAAALLDTYAAILENFVGQTPAQAPKQPSAFSTPRQPAAGASE